MKKAFLLIGVLALALGITYLVLHKSSSVDSKPQERDAPLAVSSKTTAFNRSFAGVLDHYYQLSGTFADADTTKISTAAHHLREAVDSIRFDQFKLIKTDTVYCLPEVMGCRGYLRCICIGKSPG